MSKVIKLELTTESINSAIREVEAFQKYIEDKTQELLDEMARLGYETSAFNFSWAAYDGTNDVSVNWERSGENQVAVVATGKAVLFVEFGSGITFPDSHPEANGLGMIRGEYGKKQGANPDGWYYRGDPGTYGIQNSKGKVHTYGNPANMSMYQAIRDVERDFTDIARRVFSG